MPVLLPGPLEVAAALVRLVPSAGFWGKVGFSAARILGGLALAYALAAALAWAAAAAPAIRALLAPPLVAIRATPVACVVVLLLIWAGSANVSLLAVLLMALPGLYFSLEEGLASVDARMSDLLWVHGVRGVRRALALTWPSAQPFVLASSRAVVGMAWKAGVAAELIGSPLGSIGERIYQAKLLLDTADLFAWTIVVVALSALSERSVLAVLEASASWSFSLALRLGGRRRTDSSSEGTTYVDGTETPAAVGPRGAMRLESVVLPHGTAGGNPLALEVPPGGRVCLMGPSGIGKTTLLRVLAGLSAPAAGKASAPARVSVEFQEARLFRGRSSLDNVMLLARRDVTERRARSLLAELAPGLEPARAASELSGGQARRVELARALLAEGDAVLLDEPFAGLDDEARERACAVCRRELRGRALLLATHDARDAALLGARIVRIDAPVRQLGHTQDDAQTPTKE